MHFELNEWHILGILLFVLSIGVAIGRALG